MKNLHKGLPALIALAAVLAFSSCDNGTTSGSSDGAKGAQAFANELDKFFKVSGGYSLSSSESEIVKLGGSARIELRIDSAHLNPVASVNIPKGVTLQLGGLTEGLTLISDTTGPATEETTTATFKIGGPGTLELTAAGSLILQGSNTRLILGKDLTVKYTANAAAFDTTDTTLVAADELIVWEDGATLQATGAVLLWANVPGKHPANGFNLVLSGTSSASMGSLTVVAGDKFQKVTIKQFGSFAPAAAVTNGTFAPATDIAIVVDGDITMNGGAFNPAIQIAMGNLIANGKATITPANTAPFTFYGNVTLGKDAKLIIPTSASAGASTIIFTKTLTNNGKIENALTLGELKLSGAEAKLINNGEVNLGVALGTADGSALTSVGATIENNGTIKMIYTGDTSKIGGIINLQKSAVLKNKKILDMGKDGIINLNIDGAENAPSLQLLAGSELQGINVRASGSGKTISEVTFQNVAAATAGGATVASVSLDATPSEDLGNALKGYVGVSPRGAAVSDSSPAVTIASAATADVGYVVAARDVTLSSESVIALGDATTIVGASFELDYAFE